VVLTIPAGTSSGAKMRLRGKGVPDRKKGQPGDQLVVLKIVTPKDLSDEAAELFQKLTDAAPQSPRDGQWT
jgi:DnaJ-class molecular chaperone